MAPSSDCVGGAEGKLDDLFVGHCRNAVSVTFGFWVFSCESECGVLLITIVRTERKCIYFIIFLALPMA